MSSSIYEVRFNDIPVTREMVIKVRNQLTNGTIPEHSFDMTTHECKSAACILGWIARNEDVQWQSFYYDKGLFNLFYEFGGFMDAFGHPQRKDAIVAINAHLSGSHNPWSAAIEARKYDNATRRKAK